MEAESFHVDRHDETNSHFRQFCDRVRRTCKGGRCTDRDVSFVCAKHESETLPDVEVLCLVAEIIILLDHGSSIIILNTAIPWKTLAMISSGSTNLVIK